MVLWNVMRYSLVDWYHCSDEHAASIFKAEENLEDGGNAWDEQD